MRSRIAALAAVTVICGCDGLVYNGDGKFTDRGILEAHDRYFLDLGPVDLTTPGRREYKLSGLPNKQFALGLFTTATTSPSGANLATAKPFNAKVKVHLQDENSKNVFEISDDLRNWTWSEARETYTFLYYEGPVKTGSDRGTVFSARRSSNYRLAIETVAADPAASRYGLRLVAKGGGWK